MKTNLLVIAMFAGAPSLASQVEPSRDAGVVVELEAFAGQKHLGARWRGLDRQPEIGLVTTVRPRAGATIGAAADVFHSMAERSGDGYVVRGETQELALGVRAGVGDGRVHTVAGAGLARMECRATTTWAWSSRQDRHSGFGVWYSLGLRMRIGSRAMLGFDLRQSLGKSGVRWSGDQASGVHAGATLGLRLGARESSPAGRTP